MSSRSKSVSGDAETDVVFTFGLHRAEMINRPRYALDRLQGKMPQDVWDHCFRALSAHRNAMENFTLFASAMVRTSLFDIQLSRDLLVT